MNKRDKQSVVETLAWALDQLKLAQARLEGKPITESLGWVPVKHKLGWVVSTLGAMGTRVYVLDKVITDAEAADEGTYFDLAKRFPTEPEAQAAADKRNRETLQACISVVESEILLLVPESDRTPQGRAN